MNKKNIANQRQILEKRLEGWTSLRDQKAPPSGWIKAIRGALGMSTRQLADFLEIDQSSVIRLEKRETRGRVTLETLENAAKAMGCKLVYSVVPDIPFNNLEEIIEARAKAFSQDILKKVDHSMELEKQGTDRTHSAKQVEQLVSELKSKMDSRIWRKPSAKKRRK